MLSGGLDSATCVAIAKDAGFTPYCLSFDYGQRHTIELDCARKVAAHFDVADHKIARIDVGIFAGSALTDADIAVPAAADSSDDIPVTYVPARNTVFLSYALAYAESLGAQAIFIGVNALDYSGYPDCRPDYIAAFETMANLATKAAVEGAKLTLHAPLLHMTKAEIIRTGLALGVDYDMTSSCYNPAEDGTTCGVCDACHLRNKGFAEV